MFTGVDSATLGGASDDGGTDDPRDGGSKSRTDAGTSARDSGTGTHDSGSSGGPGVECTALDSCCSTLDSAIAASCIDAVAGGAESTCASTLSSYQADGYCAGTVAPFDAGTPPPPRFDAGGAGACALLQNCCLTGAASDTTCLFTALSGNESACLTTLASYISAGTCS